MNFFQHQEKARQHTRWLLFAFIGITLLIVLLIDAIVLVVFGAQTYLNVDAGYAAQLGSTGQTAPLAGFSELFSWRVIQDNANLLLISSAITASIIGIASLSKIASLRSGGAYVAASMGGTYVAADTRDPLRRRLYNVVEEIAIASGVPVPDVFVLESEAGINAFAAGYTTADAAVAVTQGTLEKLNRAELQGVIAHEFSHIFNGDMRINIRLMGVMFGIMVLAIIGRKFLQSTAYRGSSRNKNAGGAIAVGLGLVAIGYVGLFFARWMKSALSRQREYLADASAVQFTRDPNGIANALKKIAAYQHGSYLTADPEEVSHMLFGSGARSLMFATHPPLEKRIARIETGFRSDEIGQLAKKLKQQEKREHLQATKAEQEQQKKQQDKRNGKNLGGLFDVDNIISHIGRPDMSRIAVAAEVTSRLDDGLKHAAHSAEWSPEVVMYCLLDTDVNLREKQLFIVMQEMGDLSEGKIRHLISSNGLPVTEERLPLLEIAYPSIKRRPASDIEKLLSTIDKMALVDGIIDSFEYLLSRLMQLTLFESHVPNRTRLHGRGKLKDATDALVVVISTLAAHGQNAASPQGLQYAQRAFKAGMGSVGIKHKNLSFNDDWQTQLDAALKKLDSLSATEKAKAVKAFVTTVLDDQQLITEEQEMMRVVCALIHVPLPILQTAESAESA